MKGKFKKIAAALAAVTVLVGSMASTAFADPDPVPASVYEPIHGGAPVFHKSLIVNDANAPIPGYTFTYEVTSPDDDLVSPDKGHLTVFKGPGSPTIAPVVFTANEDKTDTVIVGKGSVTHDTAVDLSSVTFTHPGVYRYFIEEKTSDEHIAMAYDVDQNVTAKTSARWRTLDVYVENQDVTSGSTVTHSLVITNYIMYEGKLDSTSKLPVSSNYATTNSPANNNSIVGKQNGASGNVVTDAVKSTGYLNFYDSHSLTVSKKVRGNQASRDEDFTFTLKVYDPAEGSYPTGKANASHTNLPDVITITPEDVDAGIKTVVFTLRADESVSFRGIVHGRKYEITEDEKDYTPTISVTAGDSDGQTKLDDGAAADYVSGANADTYLDNMTGITDNTTVEFTNERSGAIPTGIIMSVAPAAIVGLIVLAAIIAMIIAGKRREAEEE